MSDNHSHIQVVRWADLDRWDYLSNYLKTGFKIAHPLVRLSEVFRVRKREATPEETASGEVPMVDRVSFDGEIFYGERQRTKMDQFVAEPGDIVVSKIRARQGSVGLVSSGEVSVTIHYRVLIPDTERVLPRYAHLALRSRFGRTQFLAATGGAMKGEISEEALLDLQLPLPTLEEQARAVDHWNKIREESSRTEARVAERRRGINGRFFSAVGLRLSDAEELPRLLVVQWKDLTRWSVGYNQQAHVGMDLARGKYPVVTLGSVLTMVQYGTSEKANSDGRGVPILRINNIKEGAIDTEDLKTIEMDPKAEQGLLLKDGDILIIRTSGSRDLVGTCAVYHESGRYVYASYLIRLRADPDAADPDYLTWVLNSPIGREQVDATSRQIMQNNINSEEIRGLEIPLPPLEVQRRIVADVHSGLAEIAAMRAAARARIENGQAEVEQFIVGTK